MTNQILKVILILTLAFSTIVSGVIAVQALWPFDQGNSSGNQTGNQSSVGNQTNFPATPGQPGYTP
ncbi:MAG TPA: hypothetical protein VE594_03470 [Nitrososphaeraceae archaeon]|nr:hypothetical protein [Nitrososphaeraceae archaeon]